MKRLQAWFPTFIYSDRLRSKYETRLRREILKECRQIRDSDNEGRKWSAKNYPHGYTSYGSLDKVHRLSSTFMDLERAIDRHVRAFAAALEWDLADRQLAMTDCWINIMPESSAHGLHLHPLAVISGAYYVATPRGCSSLKFEDPRLSNFMAAPPRKAQCKDVNRAFVHYPAEAGNVILFESWLRHEVPPSRVSSERVSISFNYHWV